MKRTVATGILFTLLLIDVSVLAINIQEVVAVGYTNVTVQEAKSMIDSNPHLVVLDVRTQSEYDSGHIGNAKLIPLSELEGRLDELNQSDEILVYCLSGGRSASASQLLVDNGFQHVYNMLGGITAWIGEGYPVYVKYSSIQEAINNAQEGDTLFVSSGTYYENVVVNKTVSLIGENRETAIIDGNGTGRVVHLTADDVKISDFTIQNSGRDTTDSGIYFVWTIWNACIRNNIITNNQYGVYASSASRYFCTASFVDNTIASNELHGFHLSGVDAFLQNNLIHSNDRGIYVTAPADENTHVEIYNNTVCDNENGIWAEFHAVTGSVEGDIIGNNIQTNNQTGISLIGYVSLNSIYHNNFVNNTQQARMEAPAYVWDWDDGYPAGGNYWSDYNGTDLYLGPGQNFTGRDGIGDTPYVIDVENQDNYPLMKPFVSGNLSVSVYTDKDTYHVGETMHIGLNITNPDSVKYQCFALWCELPDSSIYLHVHEHSVIVPIGLEYSNPTFDSITLPSLPPGNYTWHVAFLERAIHTIIAEDTAEWEFT